MMNILLGILKITGIFLAVILGILLLLFLILGFGPIGYGGKGNWQKEKSAGGYVSWLFFVLRIRADYCRETGFQWWVRLFGILIASNDEEFIRKKEEKRRKKEAKKALKQEKQAQKELEMKQVPKEETDGQADPLEKEETISKKEPVKSETPLEVPKEPESSKEDVSSKERKTGDDVKEQTAEEKKTFLEKGKAILSGIAGQLRKLGDKIRSLVDKIKAIPAKIKGIIETVREKLEFADQVKEFFFGERNKEGFSHVWKNGKKMIRHILPVKLKGEITFGVEDPYTMGQILTVLGMLYPVYQDKLTLHPNFENQTLEGNVELKGRIIPGYLLWKVLVIIGSREVRRIINEGRELLRRK